MRKWTSRILIGIVSSYTSLAMAEFTQLPDFYSEPGASSGRAYQEDGSESIDPFGGGLQLHYVDLVAPSDQMDIVINRSYSTAEGQQYKYVRSLGLQAPKDNIIEYFGWNIHFGRLLGLHQKTCGASIIATGTEGISMEMPNGSQRQFVKGVGALVGQSVSTDFWRMKCLGTNNIEVTSPDGTKYQMDQLENHSTSRQLYPSKITNALGHSMTIEYGKKGNQAGIGKDSLYIKKVTSGSTVVNFNYESESQNTMRLKSICHSTRCVKYSGTSISGMYGFRYQLKQVIFPDFTSYQYGYKPAGGNQTGGNYAISTVTNRHKKVTSYTYGLKDFDVKRLDGTNMVQTDVVTTKRVTGPGITPKSWTYNYSPSASGDTTTVTGPITNVTYKHYGFQEVSNGDVWKIGLLKSKETKNKSGQVVQTESFDWKKYMISNDDNFRIVRNGFNFKKFDSDFYVPLQVKHKVRRDSRDYITTFEAHDAYGNPGIVTETGNAGFKKTSYTYQNDTTDWVLGKVTEEAIDGIGKTTRSYYGSTGGGAKKHALASESVYGVTTNYQYDVSGNITKKTNANNHSVTYSNYKFGIAQHEAHPEGVTISRVVNNFGNIDSENDGRGITTSFGYDNMNRIDRIQRSNFTPVIINYNFSVNGLIKTTSRGGYTKTEVHDAEGNVTSTNIGGAESISTTAQYDALSRKTFESYPNSSNGTSYSYDALGRVLSTTQPGASVSYNYQPNNQVVVTNERNHPTTYTYRSFGNPDEKSLIQINSPEGINTTIGRNTIDLVDFIEQNGVKRENKYNTKFFRTELIQPEIGKTIFGHDNMGNVTSKSVGGRTTSYGYDQLERQETINYPGDTADVIIQYDGNNNIETIDNGHTFIEMNYFDHGGIKNKTLTIDGHSFKSDYTYNSVDLLDTITYPSGEKVDMAADLFGRPTKVGDYVTSVDFHPTGLPKLVSYANGQSVEYLLNDRNWIKELNATGSSFNSLVSYRYDAIGNVETITDSEDATFDRVLTYVLFPKHPSYSFPN